MSWIKILRLFCFTVWIHINTKPTMRQQILETLPSNQSQRPLFFEVRGTPSICHSLRALHVPWVRRLGQTVAMKRRQLLEGLNAFFRRSVKSDYLIGSEVLRSSNLQQNYPVAPLFRLVWTRFNRHSFVISRLETWDWKRLGTRWYRCSMTNRNLSWTCLNFITIITMEDIGYSLVFILQQRLMSIDWPSTAPPLCWGCQLYRTSGLHGDRVWWRSLDSVRGVAPAVWWCHGGAEWNDAMWKADRLIFVSSFHFWKVPSSWVQLISFEICWRGSSFCSYWVLPFFTWKFSGFCQTTRSSEIHTDRSRFDVTPQHLGVLESSWPTAAMAPHQQWLSQKMLNVEGYVRKFLGSGWPDESQGG